MFKMGCLQIVHSIYGSDVGVEMAETYYDSMIFEMVIGVGTNIKFKIYIFFSLMLFSTLASALIKC